MVLVVQFWVTNMTQIDDHAEVKTQPIWRAEGYSAEPQGDSDSGTNSDSPGSSERSGTVGIDGAATEASTIAALLILTGGILGQLIKHAEDRLAKAHLSLQKAVDCVEWYQKEVNEAQAEVSRVSEELETLKQLYQQSLSISSDD